MTRARYSRFLPEVRFVNTRAAKTLLASLALSLALAHTGFAEPPADKGKGAAPVKDQAGSRVDDHAKGKDTGHDAPHQGKESAHGQVVSECNHRANDKKLQGKDRQEYVEWCTDRGAGTKYDDRRFEQERSCYGMAAARVDDAARRRVIEDCLRKRERSR